MNKLTVVVPFLLIAIFPLAQASAQLVTFANSNNEVLTERRYSQVQGSPYYFKSWQKGTIKDIKGNSSANASINFNGETGLVEVKEGERIIQLNENMYNEIEIVVDGNRHTFVNRLTPIDLTYYKAIYQSENMQFLAKFESVLKEEEEVATYGASKSRTKFVNKTKYYIFQDQTMKEVTRNTKKLMEQLKSPRLKSYVKKNKLNLKKDEDLVKALAYYESSLAKKK